MYVFLGSSGFFDKSEHDIAAGDWDVKLLGAAAGDDTGGSNLFGGMVCKGLCAADITGDGIGDIAAGAHLATANAKAEAGKVFVVRGRAFAHGTTLDLATQADSTILGADESGEVGTAITAGDINADGVGDLVIGNEYGSVTSFSSHGKVFVIYGSASFPASVNLGSTGWAGSRITGGASWDQLGSAVAVADINGDGRADLLATAPGWDKTGSISVDEGAVYAFFGGSSFPATINLATATPGVFVRGWDASHHIGPTLDVGDINGDGRADFMFSSRDGGRTGFDGEGRLYVVFGRAGIPAQFSVEAEDMDLIINGGQAGLQMGDTIGVGDLDGDGAAEILESSPFVASSTGILYGFDLTPIVTSARGDWALFE